MWIVITWYLALQLFALAAWPLTFGVCNRLPDRGYALSKGLGLVLITFITWALAHLASRFPALGFSFNTISGAWFAVLAVSLLSLFRHGREFSGFLRSSWRYVAILEIVLLTGFGAMVALKTVVPHISYHTTNSAPGSMMDHAAEKFTDFAVLNSLLTSSAFPPHDVWVSGQTLNYYYFGHMLWAVLIKFCSVRPEIGFNLALASAFALTLALAFGLGYNLTRKLRWAALTAFLVVLCSNLDGFLQFLTTLKMVFLDARGQNFWYVEHPWWRNYDFWRSSRAIANTINEFPAFSFILGDLHAHVSALIINLCGWNVAVQVWRGVRRYRSLWRYEVNAFDELFLAALICGGLSASNSWDVPVYAGVLALAMYCGHTGRRDPYAWVPAGQVIWGRIIEALEAVIVAGMVAVVGVLFFFYPFVKNFMPPEPAEGHMLKWVSPENRSNPFEFFTHWILLAGLPFVLALVFFKRQRLAGALDAEPTGNSARSAALLLISGAVAVVFVPLWNGWVAATMLVSAILCGVALVRNHLPPMARWMLGLVMLFCIMTCFCELVYVDDIFSGPIERINTVFKVYYGLWPMMAVTTVMALRLMLRMGRRDGGRFRTIWLIAPIILMGSPYIVLGTLNRINTSTWLGHWSPPEDSPRKDPPSALLRPEAKAKNLERALDGLRYLAYVHPDDYAAIMWIRKELPTTATLLEAAGSQYTYSGRFGTLTGRPSFDGWLTHAWGWRGAAFENENPRRTERAAQIYNETDPELTRAMLLQEHINYIIVGDQEREQYPALDERKFGEIGEKVFSRGSVSIYHFDPEKLALPAEVAPDLKLPRKAAS
jgi:YYY domain-containing protein